MVTLRDVCDIRSGEFTSACERADISPYPVYGANGVIGRGATPNLTEPAVLVGRVGSVGAVTVPTVPARATDNVLICQPRAQLDVGYLALYLRYFRPERLRSASIQPLLTGSALKSISIPLPPLDEQRRIASRLHDQLDEADRARAWTDQTARQVAELERRTLDLTFGGAAEDQWPLARLDSIAVLTDGDWILTADYSSGGVRLLQVGDVGIGEMRVKSRRWVTMKRARELNCTLLEPGDVLISRMPEPLGRAAHYRGDQDPAITAVDVTIARLNHDRIDRDYLLGYMRSSPWFEAARAKASGATRPRISRLNLGALPLPIRPLDEQRRIAARLREQLAEIDRAKAALAAQREAIDALPAALLREVFGPPGRVAGSIKP